MLKVSNRKVIGELAKTTYKANRKRNLLMIIAIFLTTFLICSVVSLGISYWNTVSQRQVRMEGMDYDIALTEPRKDQISVVRQMDDVRYAGLVVKCAVLSQYKQRMLDKVRLFWLDKTCWEKQTIPALETCEGHYPQKEGEIMLSKDALRSMGLEKPEIGMTLPLTYDTLSETAEREEGKEGENKQRDFVLSGWFLDYTGSAKGYVSEAFYRTTGVRQTDFTQGSLKISLKNSFYSEQDIIKMQKDVKLGARQVIDADYDMISSFCKTVLALGFMLFLVFFSGCLFIYNTLYISVNRDIRYYGQLKTLGTTTSQIKKLIYRQVLWNAAAGIPLGLAVSGIAGKLAIPGILHMVNPAIRVSEAGTVSLWVFGAAALFSLATALFSSRKPAKIAENCSPVEAMNYIGELRFKKNRKRQGGSLFSMARQNLLRDKKQFFVILLSLSLAVSLFFVVNIVISANDAKTILNTICDDDMEILNQTMLEESERDVITPELIGKLRAAEGVKAVRVVKSTEGKVPYQEKVYGEYYRNLYKSRYSPGNYEEDMELYKKDADNGLFTCRVIGIDRPGLDSLMRESGCSVDKGRFEAGEIALATKFFTEGDDGITGKTVKFSLPRGLNPDKEEQMRIAAVIEENPAYFAGGYTPDLIVSSAWLEKRCENLPTELVHIDYEEAFSEGTEQQIRSLIENNNLVSAESKLARYTDMKNTENQVTVLGNSIGLIIMLLALLNYANMMSAGIQNRSKEFAILESVGMTRRQMIKMVVLEGIGYALLSLFLSVLIGLPIGYAAFENFNLYGIPFSVPVVNNLLLFAMITAACMIIPVWIFKRARRETIIELLRKGEN